MHGRPDDYTELTAKERKPEEYLPRNPADHFPDGRTKVNRRGWDHGHCKFVGRRLAPSGRPSDLATRTTTTIGFVRTFIWCTEPRTSAPAQNLCVQDSGRVGFPDCSAQRRANWTSLFRHGEAVGNRGRHVVRVARAGVEQGLTRPTLDIDVHANASLEPAFTRRSGGGWIYVFKCVGSVTRCSRKRDLAAEDC
jgi:hypothetical protein